MSEPTIPTAAEITELPRWARVAFAARCARRVLPLFGRHSAADQAKYLATLEQAVSISERAAADASAAAAAAHDAAHDTTVALADYAATVALAADTSLADAAADASAAAAAARDAARAAHDATVAADTAAGYATNDAAGFAARAARDANVHAAIRSDFDRLLDAARRNGWDNRTPVSPEVFGPLWPNGPPPGWPSETGEKPGPEPAANPSAEVIEVREVEPAGEADRGAASIDTVSPPAVVVVWDPRIVSPKQYAKFVAALDRLAKSQGGAGLKRLEGRSFGAGVKQGVPV